MIRSHFLTLVLFAATIVNLHFGLAFAALDILDLGANLPNASEFGAFAVVISEEFLLHLILFADDVRIEGSTLAAITGTTGFHLHLIFLEHFVSDILCVFFSLSNAGEPNQKQKEILGKRI